MRYTGQARSIGSGVTWCLYAVVQIEDTLRACVRFISGRPADRPLLAAQRRLHEGSNALQSRHRTTRLGCNLASRSWRGDTPTRCSCVPPRTTSACCAPPCARASAVRCRFGARNSNPMFRLELRLPTDRFLPLPVGIGSAGNLRGGDQEKTACGSSCLSEALRGLFGL